MEFLRKLEYICTLIEDSKDMAKKFIVPKEKDPLKTLLVTKIAEKKGLSKSFIYKILAGDRTEPEILEEYMTAREGLVDAVEQLVPFN